MEKKVLTEILRIKELMEGKNLLNEDPGLVKGLSILKSFFTKQSDDVVKKIIKTNDDDIVKQLKNGSLDYDNATKVIRNAGGLTTFYKNAAKETFNQQNYGKFYKNFQYLKKNGNMEEILIYNDVIDNNINSALLNLPEEFRNEIKIMLKNDLKSALEFKTNPIVPNKKPKTTPNNLDNVKINQVLKNEDEIILNAAIKASFINKKIPLKYIPAFKKEFINAVVKISNDEISKISKNTIVSLNDCIKLLDNTTGNIRQNIVNEIITDFEKFINQKIPSREIDKEILVKRFKDFLLGKNFSKENGIIDSGTAFLKYWGRCVSVSTGLYLTSYAADWYAQTIGSDKANKLMANKAEVSTSSFLYRVLGGPIGTAYTFLVDFMPSIYNLLVSKMFPKKDDRNLRQKTIDSSKLFLFKAELKNIYEVLPKYIEKIKINKNGNPVYQYDENNQYEIQELSIKSPNTAYITVNDKRFYLTGPRFKQ